MNVYENILRTMAEFQPLDKNNKDSLIAAADELERLRTENAKLRDELAKLRTERDSQQRVCIGVMEERDALRTEVDTLKVTMVGYEKQRDELIRVSEERDVLASSVVKANEQAEHFEREWYLRGDRIEQLEQKRDALIHDIERAQARNTELLQERDALAATINKIADVFLIGTEVRTPMAILENASNAARRSHCLSRIESFHVTTEEDEDEDGFPIDEQLLNWGECPEQYLKTYKAVIAARDERITKPLQEQIDALAATVERLRTENAELRADAARLWKALNDLSFHCDGVTCTVAPSMHVYNCTFQVMQELRTKYAAKEKKKMSIHVCKCIHKGGDEYHLRYPGMTETAAQELADRINGGWVINPNELAKLREERDALAATVDFLRIELDALAIHGPERSDCDVCKALAAANTPANILAARDARVKAEALREAAKIADVVGGGLSARNRLMELADAIEKEAGND